MGADKRSRGAPRHDPLHVQMAKDTSLEVTAGAKRRRRGKGGSDSDGGDAKNAEFLDSKTSRKILDIVRQQQDEIELEEQEARGRVGGGVTATTGSRMAKNSFAAPQPLLAGPVGAKKGAKYGADSDEDDEAVMDGDEYEEYDVDAVDDIEIDEADAALIEKFMAKEPKKQMNLSDLIMSKIAAAEAAGEGMSSGPDGRQELVPPAMNEKIIEVYTKVGLLLSRYKSGKLPKTFKIIPSLADWEDVLYLTHPEKWTPQATYQATRIFVSNLKAKMAQRFFALVLLDRVRDDIAETKKLNYHLYMSLKKALYKPAAFFKGLLLPLCESGTCTLREAAIIGSVITKVSIPVLHSAAGLLKLAEMDYSGANSHFIRILLDKKYALPFKVVDALVFHFIRFKTDHREMPVLWHQSLLVFSQRYKEDMTPEQKDALLDLVRHKVHPQITPEIRRELQNSSSRDELMEPDAMELDI
ncbi:Bystin-domain-containing protein [Fimicolochytrium jonesii]|uniref:Bystin-domain-containing protein n=1 Tax=Fimicolochytrium jonesii TaxID=1396493 RepID=UPI0022FF13FF|nr:Bystin-domain-containing protein [Fimicolochytrium jonesii]KAI8816272.1 Bystin-domain-containing protein [Fimicolochytrium jonesii]